MAAMLYILCHLVNEPFNSTNDYQISPDGNLQGSGLAHLNQHVSLHSVISKEAIYSSESCLICFV